MSQYSCFNKPRPTESTYFAQAAWGEYRDGQGTPVRVPKYVEIKSAFDLAECAYTKQHASDPECAGCVHQKQEVA